MALCKACGEKLPSFTIGRISEYCKKCAAANPQFVNEEDAIDALVEVPTDTIFRKATYQLIAVNVGIFVLMVLRGVSPVEPSDNDLLAWGAEFGPLTLGGQYWRATSANFIHIGVAHLFLNMYCLHGLGRLAEKLLGYRGLVGMYLLTGLGGSISSLAWDPMRITAEASGAIFGIAGLLIVMLYRSSHNLDPIKAKKALSYVVRLSVTNLVVGFFIHVNNMAHLGGLLTGLIVALPLANATRQSSESLEGAMRRTFLTAVVLLVVSFGGIVVGKGVVVEAHKGHLALKSKNFASAVQHFARYLAERPNDADVHGAMGYALDEQQKDDEALMHYRRALTLDSNLTWVKMNIGKIAYLRQDYVEAERMFTEALHPDVFTAEDYHVYAYTLVQVNKNGDAEAAYRKAISKGSQDPNVFYGYAALLTKLKRFEEAAEYNKQGDSRSKPVADASK